MTRLRPFPALFCSILSLSQTISAQQTVGPVVQPQRDPLAVELLLRSYSAMGGGNWVAISTTRETVQYATTQSGSITTIPRTITTAGSSAMRIEGQEASGTSVFVLHPKRTEIQGPGEVPRKFPRLSLGNGGITHIPALSVLVRWSEPGVGVTYGGEEILDGAKVHHIVLKLPLDPTLGLGDEDTPCHIYLDSRNLFVIRLDYAVRAEGNLRMTHFVTVKYDDYRQTQGVAIPFKVTYLLGKQVMSTQAVSTFNINVVATDATFQLGGVQ